MCFFVAYLLATRLESEALGLYPMVLGDNEFKLRAGAHFSEIERAFPLV
jgi:hypothetical protein